MGFVLSVLIVVVFARPEDPNAAVTGGGGGAKLNHAYLQQWDNVDSRPSMYD